MGFNQKKMAGSGHLRYLNYIDIRALTNDKIDS